MDDFGYGSDGTDNTSATGYTSIDTDGFEYEFSDPSNSISFSKPAINGFEDLYNGSFSSIFNLELEPNRHTLLADGLLPTMFHETVDSWFAGLPDNLVSSQYFLQDFILDILPTSKLKFSKTPTNDMTKMWIFSSLDEDPPATSSTAYGALPNNGIKEKIMTALENFKFIHSWGNVLVQFWAPTMIGDKCYLKTIDQPFALREIDVDLCKYKILCQDYAVDLEEEEKLGIPGHVFQIKWPECTPNVKYYSGKEYPRSEYANSCGIRRCFALPIFEPLGRCIGVLELVDTVKDDPIQDLMEIAQIALKAAKLESTYMYFENAKGEMQIQKSPEGEIAEIDKMLTLVCKRFGILLAQVWVPYTFDVAVASTIENGPNSFNSCCAEEALAILSTTFYGKSYLLFWRRCREHLMRKGQGVVGKAIVAGRPCVCSDITKFSIRDYPLAHFAQNSGLTTSFAICLHSTSFKYGNNCYIIEFFLLAGAPRHLLHLLLRTVRQNLASLRVDSREELGSESFEVISLPVKDDHEFSELCPKSTLLPLEHGGELNGTRTSLTLGDLEQHFQMKLEDAAKSLGVSRSTLKRVCRDHGISRWPFSKRDNVSRSPPNRHAKKSIKSRVQASSSQEHRASLNNKDSSSSDPPPAEATTTVTTQLQHTSSMIIKAAYGQHIIRFKLSPSSGMAGLYENMSKRLNMEVGTFRLKYKDDEDELIWITCDNDVRDFLDFSSCLGKTIPKILVLPFMDEER